MSILNKLEWDSQFFIKKIGKIHLNGSELETHLIELFKDAQSEKYDLVYLFSDAIISNSILLSYNGKLVDTKVVFQKTITEKHVGNCNIKSYSGKQLNSHLNNLAYLSGQYSRFKRDENFKQQDFINLYDEWLKKSISREIADEVFVYTEHNDIIGFVTVVIKNNIGEIGLIAVSPEHQGKQIGSFLLKHVENYLFLNKISKLDIPTQKENSMACDFYLKNNFRILTSQNIYHFNIAH